MKKFLLLFTMAFAFGHLLAQERVVTGTVTEDGVGVPGVNVTTKGTTSGTVTDLDGKYSLSVPADGAVLLFSFVGYETKEVEVGSRSVIDVQLTPDITQLNEVVVSALLPDRNSREVVYADQTVDSEDLLTTPNKNTLEALRGKAAGVRLTTGSGSVGASTRIVLRGESSLTGDNNALIVVDGVAIDNTAMSGGEGVSTTGYADHGNRLGDINPDDIASVTILKGPSATSLYGSRGASGVVLITTKSGRKAGGLNISLNSSYSVEEAYVLLKRQNRFGQGYDNAHFDSGENWSWGPEVDGVVRPWTSAIDADGDGALEALVRPYSAIPNQVEEFFNTGHTLNNSISISGSNNNFTYYTSYSNVNQSGILDNTEYNRNTFNFNASAKLTEKLQSSFKISYADVKQNTAQEGSRAFEGNNAYAMVLQSPITIPFGELRDYNSPFHDINGYWGSYSSVNPYYILNEYGNVGNIGNLLGNISLTYNLIEGLDLVGRFGGNVVNSSIETWTPMFTPDIQNVWTDDFQLATRDTRHSSLGAYSYSNNLSINLDSYLAANYNRNLTDNFSLSATVGYNSFQKQVRRISGATQGGLVVEGVYNLANSALSSLSSQYKSNYRINGLLGNVQLGFKDAVFLELSGRNDWSSTLPAENNSFAYWAVGGSAVINDLLEIDSDALSFLKLRASYGTTGKDAGLYLLNSYFLGNPTMVALGDYALRFPLNGQPGFTVGNTIGSPDLRPELTTTFELGADIGLWEDRINIAYTYYNSQHNDQIVVVSLPRSSGFTQTTQNVGLMENKGHELSLTLRPIYGLVDGLDFELFGTYSKNDNLVKTISDEVDELTVGGPFTPGVSVVAREGMPFGTFKALAPKTNDEGKVLVDPNTGYPLYTDEEVYLGSYQPDYLASFGANLGFKGFGFNILFDVKQGGSFVSQTKFFTEFNGTSVHTVEFNREEFVYPNSMIENQDGTLSENDILITEQGLFTDYDPAASTYLVDASYVKLREVGLSYTLPVSLVSNTPIKSARVKFFAQNVKFWLPDENTFADPEVNGPALTGNAVGIETSQIPPARSFGVNLQLTF